MKIYSVEIDGIALEIMQDVDGKFIVPDHFRDLGTNLKPAFEPVVLARKPLSEKTVAANVLKWRTGALNIGACRVSHSDPLKTTERTAPRYSGRVMNSGERGGEQSVIASADPTGRWPANLVLSYPEDTFTIRPNVDNQQRAELEAWFAANPNP